MRQIEDSTRYTAPPDSHPEEPTFSSADIGEYVVKNIPCQDQRYTVDQVEDVLQTILDDIRNTDFGIVATLR